MGDDVDDNAADTTTDTAADDSGKAASDGSDVSDNDIDNAKDSDDIEDDDVSLGSVVHLKNLPLIRGWHQCITSMAVIDGLGSMWFINAAIDSLI